MERYVLKYLMDSTHDEWRKRYYDYMKMQLDSTLWAFGNNSFINLERTIEHQENFVIPRKDTIKGIYGVLRRAFERKFLKKKRLQKQASIQTSSIGATQRTCDYKVFSAFHLPWLLPDKSVKKLNEVGIYIDFISDTSMPWSKSVARMQTWYNSMKLLPFNELVSEARVQELKVIYDQLVEDFRNTDYDAVLLFSSEPFEAKVLIDVFRDLGKVSMELLHGIPGTSLLLETEIVDYFLVYGEQLKQDAISMGCDPKKLYVAGDCKYVDDFQISSKLQCSMDDVLVMTSATFKEYKREWEYDQFALNDRSLLITYLYSVENVLKQNGITHARLRPHPHVMKNWISRYVDMDFYELDYLGLEESLEKATCCIGQNSTVVIEAINHGVSYLVYEPGDGKHFITGGKLYPPFDGSNAGLKVANSEEELDTMIKERYCPSTELGKQYMEPFKPEVIREILACERAKSQKE